MVFRIVSDNRTFFKPATVALSTVQLPGEHGYESCLFTEGPSEVLATYKTLQEAVEGHNELKQKMGLK